MTTQQAIQILAAANGAYGGTFVMKITGNLIEDIMNEDCIGKTFHQFGSDGARVIVSPESLIPLAQWEQRQQRERLEAIADAMFD